MLPLDTGVWASLLSIRTLYTHTSPSPHNPPRPRAQTTYDCANKNVSNVPKGCVRIDNEGCVTRFSDAVYRRYMPAEPPYRHVGEGLEFPPPV